MTAEYKIWRYNKQFQADRTAATNKHAYPSWAKVQKPKESVVVSPDFKWRFHEFNTKKHPKAPKIKEAWNVEMGNISTKGSVRERLTHLAGTNYKGYGLSKEIIEVTFGETNREQDGQRAAMARKINPANAGTLVLDELKRVGLLDIAVENAINKFNAEVGP